MTEEEKEAIEYLENQDNSVNWNYPTLQAILGALHLIDKLQTKYEKQKKINLEQNQFIDTLKTNIIKQQKVIDLMAEDIYENDNFWKLKCAFEKIGKGEEKDYIKERFFKKAEE